MVKGDLKFIWVCKEKIQPLSKAFQTIPLKMITTFYRRMVIVIQPLTNPLPELNPCSMERIQTLTKKDLSAYLKFRPNVSLHLIEARLEHGDLCFATWENGQIVNALWVAIQTPYIPYLRQHLLLQKGDIYIYDHYTLPAYQRRGLGQTNVVYVLRSYREKGFRRSISLLAIENKAAFGPIRTLGMPVVGLFGCVRFGPWQWDWKEAWSNESLPILVKIKREDK